MDFSEISKLLEKATYPISKNIKFKINIWVVLDENSETKESYIFQKNNKLLITIDGIGKYGIWDVIDNESVLIEVDNVPILYKHIFVEDLFLVLRRDNSENVIILITESFYNSGIKTINDFITYLFTLSQKSQNLNKYRTESENNRVNEQEFENKSVNEQLKFIELNLIENKKINVEYMNLNELRIGLNVYDCDFKPLKDGIFTTTDNKRIYVEEFIIKKINLISEFSMIGHGKVLFEHQDPINILKGDMIISDINFNGVYNLNWFEKIHVENNIVVKRKILGI